MLSSHRLNFNKIKRVFPLEPLNTCPVYCHFSFVSLIFFLFLQFFFFFSFSLFHIFFEAHFCLNSMQIFYISYFVFSTYLQYPSVEPLFKASIFSTLPYSISKTHIHSSILKIHNSLKSSSWSWS